jgi:DNA topoisomerase VI subunit A
LITAKGFPDLATRELLSLIHNVPDYRHNLTEQIPMFCLVDNDPYGLNIYGVYKYGGDRSSVIERERLALPTLRYMGISALDFDDEGMIELTQRDKRKIELMLKKEWVQKEPEIQYVLAVRC